MEPNLGVRAFVDEHDLLHWEIYDRVTGDVQMRRRAAPKRGYYGHTQLSQTLELLQEKV